MNICVFCSSASDLDSKYIEAAQQLGTTMAKHKHTLVFGGYDMGLMGAVANAAVEAGGKVIGITTAGLTRKGRDVVKGIEVHEAEDLSARKQIMIDLADAFVTLPGGIGTFDEFFSVLSCVKAGEVTGKSALMDVDDFFAPLVLLLDESTKKGLNNMDWRTVGNSFTNAEDLLNWLEE